MTRQELDKKFAQFDKIVRSHDPSEKAMAFAADLYEDVSTTDVLDHIVPMLWFLCLKTENPNIRVNFNIDKGVKVELQVLEKGEND